MMEVKKEPSLAELDTYIFVDASNIRSACLKTLGWRLDFGKLAWHFTNKYRHLQEMRYYEGIAQDDWKKRKTFRKLKEVGYKICSLKRKSYTDELIMEDDVACDSCGASQSVVLTKEVTKLKSNVDVYLASELLKTAFLAKRPVHIILVACDGDYAEMIKCALSVNRNVCITVIATPVVPLITLPNGKTKNINSCSTRLQALKGKKNPRFYLTDIRDIQDYIQEQK